MPIDYSSWEPTLLTRNASCADCKVALPVATKVLASPTSDSFACLAHGSLPIFTELGDKFQEQVDKIAESPIGRKHSRFMAVVLTSSVVAVTGVIVFLSLILPASYRAEDWDVAWVGFDCGLLVLLALTLWAVLRHRQVSIIYSALSGLMLVIDSWFDVSTAQRGHDFLVALATAVFLQLPFAFVLFRFSRNLMRKSLASVYSKAGLSLSATSIFKAPLTLPEDYE